MQQSERLGDWNRSAAIFEGLADSMSRGLFIRLPAWITVSVGFRDNHLVLVRLATPKSATRLSWGQDGNRTVLDFGHTQSWYIFNPSAVSPPRFHERMCDSTAFPQLRRSVRTRLDQEPLTSSQPKDGSARR